MDNIERMKELSDRIKFPSFDAFPDIELYMDQVVDFLSRSRTSLRDDDKISSAMVNNYIKAEILPRARGKKYSKEHLAYLAVIMRMKQVLSVKDTGALIKINKLGKTDEEFYDGFRSMVDSCAEQMSEEVLKSDDKLADVAMSLAVQSYLCKIACEYIIDIVVDDYWKNSEKTEDTSKGK